MLPHSSSGASIHDLMKDPAALSDFDHIFSDQELASFLDSVAQGEGLALPGEHSHPAPGGCFPLQFLPADAPEVQCPPPAVTSAMSSYDELPPSHQQAPLPAPAGIQTAAPATLSSAGSASDHQLKTLGLLAQGTNPSLDLRALQTLLAGHSSANTSLAPPPPGSATSSSLLRGQTAPLPLSSSSKSAAKAAVDNKPQISHSTVEKQRRDRINALIDELRELVPPSKATQAAAAAGGGSSKDNSNSEARRPKHVVLADTISLLKLLQLRGPLANLLITPSIAGGTGAGACADGMMDVTVQHGRSGSGDMGAQCMAPAGPPMKEERVSPTNSNSKGSVSSREDVDMKDEARTAAPKLPHIPAQPTLLAGVVVEQGPDCMYVQVRCRDRKGLLLDIINALRNMPLEIRTAAVTTQPDGQVRDVFEVCVDDKSLQPEEIQSMVHEALFQQYHLSAEAHKRARAG